MKEIKAGTARPDVPKDKSEAEESGARRDADMGSPSDIRNTTAPRKVKDMPEDEDEGYRDRDPEKDYDGEAAKGH